MAKGTVEAQAFLTSLRTAYEFAVAVSELGPVEDRKAALELEVQQLGNNRQILVDELAELRKLSVEESKNIGKLKEEAANIISTASVEKDEIIRTAHAEAKALKEAAKVDSDRDLEVANKELALALTELKESTEQIRVDKMVLATIKSDIEALKHKFEE